MYWKFSRQVNRQGVIPIINLKLRLEIVEEIL